MKILVVAPHPDDEVLGCGGTIAKHVAKGDDVHLCIVSKGYTPDWSEEFLKNRPKEIDNVKDILGIKEVHFLNFPAVKLDTIPQKTLNDSISSVFNKVMPDILYIPHIGDLNKDHRLVFESCLVAARPIKHKIKKILSYETLSETEWGVPSNQFVPNVYINISDTIEKKKEAMKAYESELKQYPQPRSLEIIDALAKKRGSESGVKFAESFILIREIGE